MLCINKAERRQPLDIFLSAANFTDLSALASRRQLDPIYKPKSTLKVFVLQSNLIYLVDYTSNLVSFIVIDISANIIDNQISMRQIYAVWYGRQSQTSSYFQRNESMLTFDYLAAVSEALHLMYRRRLRGIVGRQLI